MVVWGAVVSTVHVLKAGVASVLPVASVALTWKVCEPSERLTKLFGELHKAKASSSREHSKVELGSEEVKAKLAELMLSVPEEPESMLVCGGVWSGSGTAAAPVLNDQALSAPSELPARSLTPVAPPFSVAR
jgi:hypothetical protein